MLYFFGNDFILILVAFIVLALVGMMPGIINGLLGALGFASFFIFFGFTLYLLIRYIRGLRSNGTYSSGKLGIGLLIWIFTLLVGYYVVFYITGMIHYVDNFFSIFF